MSNGIKAGDLVMVVKPTLCCGNATTLGRIFTVMNVAPALMFCEWCGDISEHMCADVDGEYSAEIERLKKIDPPADGDSLPTRKDLEVPA